MSIKENIRALCIANGTSLPKLEAALGFGNSTISKWDTASPTLAKLEAVAHYFDVPVSEIIGEQNAEKPLPVGEELDASLVELLMELSPDEAVKAKAYMQGMIANRK